MRYIRVPEPVILEHIPGGVTQCSLSDLIRKILPSDPRTTQDDAAVTKFMELTGAVKSLSPGDIWELESDVHEFLSLIARTFPNYHPEAKVSMLPLIKAITGAPTEKPAGFKSAKDDKSGDKPADNAPEKS